MDIFYKETAPLLVIYLLKEEYQADKKVKIKYWREISQIKQKITASSISLLYAGSFRGERSIYTRWDRCLLIIGTGLSVVLNYFYRYFATDEKCAIKIKGTFPW